MSKGLEELARAKVASGMYTSASEVVREALPLMVEQGTREGRTFRIPAQLSVRPLRDFYFPIEDGIDVDVVRVLHGARDIDAVFDENP